MRKPTKALIPLAAAALAVAMSPGTAFADHADGTYQSTLNPLNNQNGSGMATVSIQGDTATINVTWSGLAETFMDGPFPHVQHIHIGARGECPTQADDQDGDGVVSVPEGAPAYGDIGTTLSLKGDTSPAAATDINVAPGGGSVEYNRTIQLSEATLDSLAEGTGVVVVHGLDPSLISKKAQNAKSPLVPELPLAATAPALCGPLSGMPAGGVATGGGETAGIENAGMLGLGGGLLAVAAVGGVLAQRRRATERV